MGQPRSSCRGGPNGIVHSPSMECTASGQLKLSKIVPDDFVEPSTRVRIDLLAQWYSSMAVPEGLCIPIHGMHRERRATAVQNRSRRFCRTLYSCSNASARAIACNAMALPEGFEPSYQP